MPSIAPDSILEDAVYAVVKIRSKWAGYWTAISGLLADSITYAASPDIPRATLTFYYGDVKPYGRDDFGYYPFAESTTPETEGLPLEAPLPFVKAFRPYLEIMRWYVKIETWADMYGFGDSPSSSPTRVPTKIGSWYGVIEEEEVDRADSVSGKQTFIAYGLEMLLERQQVDRSRCATVDRGGPFSIDRAIQFNRGRGRTADGIFFVKGNKAKKVNAAGLYIQLSPDVPVFCGQFGLEAGVTQEDPTVQFGSNESEPWTAEDIIRYLLKFLPGDNDREPGITWELVSDSPRVGQLSFQPIVKPDGRSVKSVIDELLSRQRLLGWQVRVNEGNNRMQVFWFPMTPEPIQLSEGVILTAAENQSNLVLRGPQFGQVQAQIRRTHLHCYDRVRVRGGKMGITFTIRKLVFPDSARFDKEQSHTIATSWTTSEQIAYEEGGKTDPETQGEFWESLYTAYKQRVNARVRSKPRLEKVFSWLRVPDEAVGFGDPVQWVAAGLANDIFDALKLIRRNWRPGLRFSRQLPLLKSVDYSGDRIRSKEWVQTAAQQMVPQPLPIKFWLQETELAYLTDIGTAQPANDTWVDMSNPERGSVLSPYADGGGLSEIFCHVQPMEGDYGLILDIQDSRSGGGGRHCLWYSIYNHDRLDGADRLLDLPAVYDLVTGKFAVTVHVETDSFCEAATPSLDRQPGQRELIVDMGDDYRLEGVEANTAVGVGLLHGTLVVTDGGWLYDDRPKLQELANLAYEWYSRPRYAIRLQAKLPQFLRFSIGDLIRNVVNEVAEPRQINAGPSPAAPQCTIDSSVTMISLNFITGEAELATDFGQLDVRLFVR